MLENIEQVKKIIINSLEKQANIVGKFLICEINNELKEFKIDKSLLNQIYTSNEFNIQEENMQTTISLK